MTRATARLLVGRRIIGFKPQPFNGGTRAHRSIHYDPVILLDNGAWLSFSGTETEIGETGVDVSYHKPGTVIP